MTASLAPSRVPSRRRTIGSVSCTHEKRHDKKKKSLTFTDTRLWAKKATLQHNIHHIFACPLCIYDTQFRGHYRGKGDNRDILDTVRPRLTTPKATSHAPTPPRINHVTASEPPPPPLFDHGIQYIIIIFMYDRVFTWFWKAENTG